MYIPCRGGNIVAPPAFPSLNLILMLLELGIFWVLQQLKLANHTWVYQK